ncbi:MAG: DUF799 domain-containing protein [Opitutales bacterium]
MKNPRFLGLAVCALGALVLSGCATPAEVDYTAYTQHYPRSILVLPPLNQSPDTKGTYGYYTTITQPLAEHGYYVFPIGVVDEFMKANGLPTAGEMHQAPLDKIEEIFGADAVLYINLQEYGTEYAILSSSTYVVADARLVDVGTGTELWKGRVSHVQSPGSSGGGLVGSLVSAALNQVIGEISDQAHLASKVANQQFRQPGALLPGPYLPRDDAN